VLPAEAVCFAALTMAFGLDLWFYAPAVALFIGWRMFQLAYLWDASLGLPWRLGRERAVTLYGYQFLGEFYTNWFPLFMLVALAWRWPEYLALAAAYLAVFQNGLVNFFKYDLRYVAAGVGKMTKRNG
jgi:hypothetical protein